MSDDYENHAESEGFDLQKFIRDLNDLKPFRPSDRWLRKHVHMETPITRLKGSLDTIIAKFESLRKDFEKQCEEKVLSQLAANAELSIDIVPYHKTDGLTQEQIEFTADERWDVMEVSWSLVVSDGPLYGAISLEFYIYITKDNESMFCMRVGKVDDFDAVREELLDAIARARDSSGQDVIEP